MAEASLAGKVVVVLGASSGYGLAASQQLLRQGATVFMATRHESPAELASIARSSSNGFFVETDVRDPDSVASLANRAVVETGRIDAWVNSASIGTLGHFTSISLQAHVDVITTDLIGSLYGSMAAIGQFISQETSGVLINVAADPDSLALPYMSLMLQPSRAWSA